jgi:hypothetical protein
MGATAPSFYVLGNGPPQLIVGRYVHRVFSESETFKSETPPRLRAV